MKEILLEDLLHILEKETKNPIKIKFNQHNGFTDPMDLYKANPDVINNQWLFWRNKMRYFDVADIAICFLKLSNETWLLTTIKKVTKELNVLCGINYEGEELQEYAQFFGRVIVKYHKSHQTQLRRYDSIKDKLAVIQILPTLFDGEDFPGYDKVRLSYQQLKTIIDRNKRDWIAALENQKAVYLITDTHTGKLYVGSATSEHGMLLQRWKNYVSNGHGGNIGLIELVKKEGFDYVKKYFQYSILENYNAKVEDDIILNRESWWKEIFKSREFGYNKN